MYTAFLILIIVVLSAGLLFGLIIWYQTIKVQKKAAVAKAKQEEYIQLLRQQKEEAKAAEAAKVEESTKPEEEAKVE